MIPLQLRNYVLLVLLFAMQFNLQANSLDYKVQKGDLLQLAFPGEEAFQAPFAVDRQGRIMLPEVGVVQVDGMTVNEIQNLLVEQLANAYVDLQILKVYVLKKQLIINVRGYVKQPGEFILQSDASIQLAIHASGGLRAGAQLDRLQLIRNNETSVFNYKQYLDSGDRSLLPELQSMDTLFIPASPMTGNVEVEFNPAEMTNAGNTANDTQAIKIF